MTTDVDVYSLSSGEDAIARVIDLERALVNNQAEKVRVLEQQVCFTYDLFKVNYMFALDLALT